MIFATDKMNNPRPNKTQTKMANGPSPLSSATARAIETVAVLARVTIIAPNDATNASPWSRLDATTAFEGVVHVAPPLGGEAAVLTLEVRTYLRCSARKANEAEAREKTEG